MQIESVVLENFKPFYGRDRIDLSVDEERSVILIGGLNDRGKTSLFEAVRWCLYGFSGAYGHAAESRRSAINRDAWEERDGTTAVEIVFSHRGQEYKIARVIDFAGEEYLDDIRSKHESVEVVRDPEGESQVEITKSDPDKKYNEFMNRILPEPASDFFFFDGEEIDEYAEIEIENRESVQEAIEAVLGTQEIKTAISDLNEHGVDHYQSLLDKAFEQREEYEELQEAYDEIEDQVKSKQNERSAKQEEIEELEKQIKKIENRLEKLRGERETADEIESLESDLEEKKEELEKARDSIRTIQSQLGTLIVGAAAGDADQSTPNPQEGAEFIEYLLDNSEEGTFLGIELSRSDRQAIRERCERLKDGFDGGLAGLQMKLDEQSSAVSIELDGGTPTNEVDQYEDYKTTFENSGVEIEDIKEDIAELEEQVDEDLQERIDEAKEEKRELELTHRSEETRLEQLSVELDSLRNQRDNIEDEMEEKAQSITSTAA